MRWSPPAGCSINLIEVLLYLVNSIMASADELVSRPGPGWERLTWWGCWDWWWRRSGTADGGSAASGVEALVNYLQVVAVEVADVGRVVAGPK
jgi:hypothetical protein